MGRERSRKAGAMIGRSLLRPNRVGFLGIVPAAGGGCVLGLTSVTTALPVLARSIALGFLIASLLGAFIPRRRDVRTHLSVACAIIAVTVSGQTRTGLPYMIACSLFAAIVLVCLRAPLVSARLYGGETDVSRLPRDGTSRGSSASTTPARRPVAVAVVAAVTAAVATLLVLALPPAGAAAERRIQRWAGNGALPDDRVGFATRIHIGSLTHMLDSDRVVMRIQGEPVDYLRGVVLDDYSTRTWSSRRTKTTVPLFAEAPIESATTHIELSRVALGGAVEEPRWFLPQDACDIRTPSGRMGLDALGGAHPTPPNNAREIWFRRSTTGTCTTTLADPAPPNVNDVSLSPPVLSALYPVATEWTQGATTKREALDKIIAHLARYEYAIEDRREGELDPVVEFVTVHHRGHCELFASALALLARSVEIPTRIVVGYRVDEVNPITGRAVVRDRNAHTWVEAWDGFRWVSLDPTPISEIHARTRSSSWEDAAEALSFFWDRTLGFFARIGLARTGIFAAVVAVVLIIVRRVLRRGSKGKGTTLASSRPLPAFEALAAALASAGFQRSESEPLERFVRRVVDAGEPWSAEVADVLTRYAELRYGGIGEERTIAERLEALARKIVPA